MPKLYLQNLSVISFNQEKQQAPRNRFKQFYSDLHHANECAAICESSYLQGAQLTWVYLGEILLAKLAAVGLLKDLELLIICSWSPEFDTDATCGAHLCHQYQLSAATMDVMDQGLLAAATALKIIHQNFLHHKTQNALLLCFDQNSIPRVADFNGCLPEMSGAAALYFTAQKEIATLAEVTAVTLKSKPCKYQKIGTQRSPLNCANVLQPLGSAPAGKHLLHIQDVESSSFALINFESFGVKR